MKKLISLLAVLGIGATGASGVISCSNNDSSQSDDSKANETDLAKLITVTTIDIRENGNAYELYQYIVSEDVPAGDGDNQSTKWDVDHPNANPYIWIINQLNKTNFSELNDNNPDINIVYFDESTAQVIPTENSRYTGSVVITRYYTE